MPVQTIMCPECQGKAYIIVQVPYKVKDDSGKIKIQYKKKRLSCPRCGGLGVVESEIPDFVPEFLRKFVNV